MAFWDDLKTKASSLAAGVTGEVSKYKNQGFLDAAMAGCALIAAADGKIGSEEKQKMLKFVQGSEALKVFGADVVIATFNKAAAKIEADADFGPAELLQTIGRFKGKPEAPTLVRLCIAIGSSDGNFDELEKKVARGICRELGLNPADFDL